VLELSGGKEPIRIPADTYTLGECKEYALRDGRRVGEVSYIDGTGRQFRADPGGTMALPSVVPLRGPVKVEQSGDTVRVSVNVLTDWWADVIYLRVLDRRGRMNPPPAPRVKVLDEHGQVIYEGKMAYG
jgi:hypothetical protein